MKPERCLGREAIATNPWRSGKGMPELSIRKRKRAARAGGRAVMILFFLLLFSGTVGAQSWSWTYELLDLPAKFPSLAVDSSSNLHISYADNTGALKYGFRPAGSAKWFFMVLDKQLGAFTTKLTLDFDNETGKWNSMVLDAQSNPLISYSAWYNGELRLAHWNGQKWEFNTADSRTRSHGEFNIGEGNSLTLDSDGKPYISFYSEKAVKYAHLVGEDWKIETVDQFTWLGGWAHFRSSIVLDKHARPHICYEDAGFLKHAYWDGKQWRIPVLSRNGLESLRYATIAIDKHDTVYVAFPDPEDNTLKLP